MKCSRATLINLFVERNMTSKTNCHSENSSDKKMTHLDLIGSSFDYF